MLRGLAFRDQPDVLFRQLNAEPNARASVPDLVKALRDYLTQSTRHSASRAGRLGGDAAFRRADVTLAGTGTMDGYAQGHVTRRRAVAGEGRRQGGERACADAGQVPVKDPAWLTAQYYKLRLTTGSAGRGTAPQGDRVLARDLSNSDCNLFRGVCAQLASSLADMMAFAQRHAFCSDTEYLCQGEGWLRADGTLTPGVARAGMS